MSAWVHGANVSGRVPTRSTVVWMVGVRRGAIRSVVGDGRRRWGRIDGTVFGRRERKWSAVDSDGLKSAKRYSTLVRVNLEEPQVAEITFFFFSAHA